MDFTFPFSISKENQVLAEDLFIAVRSFLQFERWKSGKPSRLNTEINVFDFKQILVFQRMDRERTLLLPSL
jgi:hypothetical protein